MRPEDKAEFVQTVAAMAAHKRQTLSAVDHKFWWMGMQDWTLEDFQAAAFVLVKREDFMPNMKHFEDLRKAGRMTAGEAWDKVVTHVRTSAYEHGGINPLIDQCVRATVGSYRQLAMSNVSDTHWLEKRFAEHYGTISDVQDTRHALPQITLHEPSLTPRLAADIKRLTAAKAVA